jgi:TetR/AcrR family transcriptional regulator, cholesterol catabolism regulator
MQTQDSNESRSQPRRSRRDQVIAAAVEVFATSGYDGASLREIAERIGISKGNLSYYFSRKSDLLFEIVDGLHTEFVVLAQGWTDMASADASPADTLRDACSTHVHLVCTNLSRARVSYESFRYLNSDRRRTIVAKRDAYEASLTRVVAASQPDADSVDLAIRVRTVLGMLNWPYQWFKLRGPIEIDELARQIADMAVRAVSERE